MNPDDLDAVNREYGKLAPDYDQRWSFYIRATLRETLNRFELHPGERLLDVGCGTGALLGALAASSEGVKLHGTDPSSEMLEMARQKLDTSVVLKPGRADDLPFPDQVFDVVVSTNAFHYFRDPIAAIGEMARVLRPRGRLVITDWCDDFLACRLCNLWLRLFDPAHFRTYGQKEFRQLLEQAGFQITLLDRYKIDWRWGLMTAVACKGS